jgi:type I restriction enzyme S subunit
MLEDAKARWPLKPLSEVVDLNPRLDKSGYRDNLDVSFVPMAAVEAGSGRMDVSQTKQFSAVKKGYTPFKERDVLFAKITPCMENGKMAVVPKLTNGVGFGSTEFHVLRPRPGIEPRYVYHFVSNTSFRREAAHHMTGAVGQKRVPTSFLEVASIPVPPFDQQQLLVAEIEKQFSRLDEAVANLKRVKANLKRYKASVLKAAVEGKLTEDWRKQHPDVEPASKLLEQILAQRRAKWSGRVTFSELTPPDTTNFPVLPSTWTWASIDQLSNVVRGASPRPAGDPRYFGGSIPWITVGPITADKKPYLTAVPETVTEEGKERSRYIEPDTLLLTNSGATLGVPKITLIGGCINDGVAALLDVGQPLKLYLLYFLHTRTAQLRGVNQGAAQPNLNTSIIKAINVPLPPQQEQERIVAEVERRLSVIEELEAAVKANLTRADRLRQSILQRAFIGEF